jgi:hypothetical protein
MADYNGMEALLASTENLTQLLNNVGHDDDTLTFNGVDWFKFNGVQLRAFMSAAIAGSGLAQASSSCRFAGETQSSGTSGAKKARYTTTISSCG